MIDDIVKSLQALSSIIKSFVIFECSFIFQTLKLNHKARSETTEGKVINLSSTDDLRYDTVCWFCARCKM